MPLADAYVDAATYRKAIRMTDASRDDAILLSLAAIARYIDRITDRVNTGFSRDTAAQTRVYYPRGFQAGDPEAENPFRGLRSSRILDIDEFAVVPTSVIIDTNRSGSFAGYTPLTNPNVDGVTGGDYQCLPLNANKGPEPKPWTQLYIPAWSAQSGFWPGCPVQVTVPYGYPSVPAAIAQASIQFGAMLRIENPRATSNLAEGVDAAIAESPDSKSIVMNLVKMYKRQRAYS